MTVSELLGADRRIPRPTQAQIDDEILACAPANDLGEWAGFAFLTRLSEIRNDDHMHLVDASVRFAWAFRPDKEKGRPVLGRAGFGKGSGKAWAKARHEQLMLDWYGEVPDFLITIDGVWAFQEASDLELAAVIDHELYHCGYVTDESGAPVLNPETQLPQWYIRGHDIEEFVGVARRWGAWNDGLRTMRDALNAPPLFGEVAIAGVCGTCLKR